MADEANRGGKWTSWRWRDQEITTSTPTGALTALGGFRRPTRPVGGYQALRAGCVAAAPPRAVLSLNACLRRRAQRTATIRPNG